ncbi:MAG TPA: hypothetical protein VND64_23130 [Pirellulales bacterium]|nr:hypothetical protein [Pirellulales bacterium]
MDMKQEQNPQVVDRQARIAEIRCEIEAGTYETPARLEAAIDSFLFLESSPTRSARGKNLRAGASGVEFLE